MTDIFKSTPLPGAKVYDCTKGVVVVDITNAIGEKYHFENKAGDVDNLPTRASDSPASKHAKVFVDATILVGE